MSGGSRQQRVNRITVIGRPLNMSHPTTLTEQPSAFVSGLLVRTHLSVLTLRSAFFFKRAACKFQLTAVATRTQLGCPHSQVIPARLLSPAARQDGLQYSSSFDTGQSHVSLAQTCISFSSAITTPLCGGGRFLSRLITTSV